MVDWHLNSSSKTKNWDESLGWLSCQPRRWAIIVYWRSGSVCLEFSHLSKSWRAFSKILSTPSPWHVQTCAASSGLSQWGHKSSSLIFHCFIKFPTLHILLKCFEMKILVERLASFIAVPIVPIDLVDYSCWQFIFTLLVIYCLFRVSHIIDVSFQVKCYLFTPETPWLTRYLVMTRWAFCYSHIVFCPGVHFYL